MEYLKIEINTLANSICTPSHRKFPLFYQPIKFHKTITYLLRYNSKILKNNFSEVVSAPFEIGLDYFSYRRRKIIIARVLWFLVWFYGDFVGAKPSFCRDLNCNSIWLFDGLPWVFQGSVFHVPMLFDVTNKLKKNIVLWLVEK